MDPSKTQSDADNDVNSLEGTGTVVEEKNGQNTSAGPAAGGATDATNGAQLPSAKPPFFKRLWQKFNIYLLLFILVIMIAVAVSIILFIKNRNDTTPQKDVINSQNLSSDALKQLANTSVNIGNSKQVLNIQSNSIFAGAVLVRSDLEVAGSIKVGGALQLPGITVSGSSRFSQLQADSVAVAGNTTIQGTLTASKGINATGTSTFGAINASQVSTNVLQLNGDLSLTHHITAGGPIPSLSNGTALGTGGTSSVSGSDTSGTVAVNVGSNPGAGCFATVNFVRQFNATPHVIITPVGSGAAAVQYYVNRNTSSFSICTLNPAPSGQSFGFDYMVLD